MDDGLAEKLFNAFWDPIVARGWPKPCAWSDLHDTQREAWEQVAIAARGIFAGKVNAEVEMLHGAIDGWRSENERLTGELAETEESLRCALQAVRDQFPASVAAIREQRDEALRDRDELMAYVDEAKKAADAGGRVTGEPLAEFIKRTLEDKQAVVADAVATLETTRDDLVAAHTASADRLKNFMNALRAEGLTDEQLAKALERVVRERQ